MGGVCGREEKNRDTRTRSKKNINDPPASGRCATRVENVKTTYATSETTSDLCNAYNENEEINCLSSFSFRFTPLLVARGSYTCSRSERFVPHIAVGATRFGTFAG